MDNSISLEGGQIALFLLSCEAFLLSRANRTLYCQGLPETWLSLDPIFACSEDIFFPVTERI